MRRRLKEITNQTLHDMAREIVKQQKNAQSEGEPIDTEDKILIDLWFDWLEDKLTEDEE